MEKTQVNPSKIMQIGMGFWASKTLLTAVKLGLFTHLSKGAVSGENIQGALGLHNRSLYDFLDTLVALGFLNRTGIRETALYSNSADSDFFLDKNKLSYLGGILEMSDSRLYGFWDNLEEGLKTGLPQNESKGGGASLFDAIYADETKLREFVNAMAGIQMGNFIAFSKIFDFSDYKTLCDLGGAGGYLAAQVAMNNDHMSCISYDLPAVGPVAQENIDRMGLSERVAIQSGDFFNDPVPKADIISMCNILHDWSEEEKMVLIQKSYDALNDGGSLVVVENIIDDDRRENAFGLMMSLNMLIETSDGYDFSAADFDVWAKKAGFKHTSKLPLTGPSSAVIAVK